MEFNKTSLLGLLQQNNKKLSKKLSQSFLIDQNIAKKIVSFANLTENDTVLEIGSGWGILTNEILKKNLRLFAIEKDDFFCKQLQNTFQNHPNFHFTHADFLKTQLTSILPQHENHKIKVVANIPYNITSLILQKLCQHHLLFSSIVLMLQKEFAERLLATENSKDYGSITIFLKCYANASPLFQVDKNCFFPKPKVDSTVLLLEIKNRLPLTDLKSFHQFVQTAFSQRRKQLLGVLKRKFKNPNLDLIFSELAIEKNARAENLRFEQFLTLFKKLFDIK